MARRTISPGRRFVETTRPRRRAGLSLGSALRVCAVVAAFSLGSTATFALWSDAATTADLTLSQAVFGFSVSRNGTTDVITSATGTASFSLGPAEAQALVAAGPDAAGRFAIALPFEVGLATPAGYGMDYTLTLPPLDQDSVLGLGGANPTFFRVSDPSACTVAAADTATAYTVGTAVTGLDPDATESQTLVDYWCAVIAVEPPVYENTATASGTDAIGRVVDSVAGSASRWSAYLIPDPVTEPAISVTLSPSVYSSCPA